MLLKDDFFEFDLQLFADLDGAEDDNPDIGDDGDFDDDDTQEDVSLEVILASIGDDDEEPGDHDESEEDGDDGKNHNQEDDDIESIINQRVIEEVNRIIPQRLARDRKTQMVQELEQMTGMTLEQIKEQVIENAVMDTADRMGISEEEAREIVLAKYENAGLKAEKTSKEQEEAELSAAQRQINYLKDKTEYSRKPKLARVLTKEVIKEIDKFTQNGTLLSFEDGMKYVLGAKLATGELIERVQAGAANKAKRNNTRATVPQSRGSGNKSKSTALTKEERYIAASLGISEKEYAAEKTKRENERRRRVR